MKRYLVVVAVALVSLAIFWLPLLLKTEIFWGIDFRRAGMETIVQNFDGLNYLVVAKSMYNPVVIAEKFAGLANPPIYYSAHFPLYPILIKMFDGLWSGPQALIASIILSNILLAAGLYFFFATILKNQKTAVMIAILALFLPARMLSVRGVGASEPLFMFFILGSLAMAYKGKHYSAAILGSLAVVCRSPGIFLFGAYFGAALISYLRGTKEVIKSFVPYLMMPLALVLVFTLYSLQLGNFWAYFNGSSELHPVFFPPFLIFSNMQKWISDMWREDIFYTYLVYGIGIIAYAQRVWSEKDFGKLAVAVYGIFYAVILLNVSHRDLARYALPLAPIMLLGYEKYLSHTTLKWMLILVLPIYLMGWQFVLANVQGVADWTPFL